MISLKRIKRKLHNAILKTITCIAVVTLIIGCCLADSPNIEIPFCMCMISEAWLALFGYANGWFEDELEEGDE